MEKQTIKKNNLLYEKKYPIKYYEMDFNRALKPSALMNFLQDMATENAELLGFGPSFVFSKNLAWFLIKYHMEFDEYPCALDEIVIKTEPRGTSRIVANRDFEIFTTDNKKLGRVASNWMLIDLATKNVLPLAKTFPEKMFAMPYEKRENDLQFQKIKPPENINFEKRFEIRFDDIDVNQHVNNANYIVWAFETIPYEFKANHKLKTLDIVYKKEIAYGHEIISQVDFCQVSKTSTHILKNATNGDELCMICAEWQ